MNNKLYQECNLSEGCQLAKAYVKFQVFDQVFNQSEALRRGTLFPELYIPYVPTENGMMNGGRYHG
jgi:hypothetical protein